MPQNYLSPGQATETCGDLKTGQCALSRRIKHQAGRNLSLHNQEKQNESCDFAIILTLTCVSELQRLFIQSSSIIWDYYMIHFIKLHMMKFSLVT